MIDIFCCSPSIWRTVSLAIMKLCRQDFLRQNGGEKILKFYIVFLLGFLSAAARQQQNVQKLRPRVLKKRLVVRWKSDGVPKQMNTLRRISFATPHGGRRATPHWMLPWKTIRQIQDGNRQLNRCCYRMIQTFSATFPFLKPQPSRTFEVMMLVS